MQHGSQQLAEWIQRTGLSQRAAALKLGFHWTTINKFLTGKRLPGRQNAIDLQDRTGIPVAAWTPTRVARTRKSDKRHGANSQYWQGGNANAR